MKPINRNNTRLTARHAVWSAAIATVAALALTGTSAVAALVQPFTPGNIAVERLGDGVVALNVNANPMYFDEFLAGATNPAPVQTIAIPTNGVNNFVEGNSTASGEMTLAADGQSIVFPGGVTNLSSTVSLSAGSSIAVPRGVGKLDGNGSFSIVLQATNIYHNGAFRGVAADGNGNYWGVGNASGSGGIYYLGTTSASNDIYSGNLRCCAIWNGNLCYSTGSGTPGVGVWQFAGLPTVTNVAGNTATRLLTVSGSPYNFCISPDGLTMFVADDGASVGIIKYTRPDTSSAFSSAYTLFGKGCYGLTVDWSTGPATVYATTVQGSGNNAFIVLSDTGANANPTTNALAGTGKIFRNLSFAPTNATVVALAPSITGISPTALTVNIGGTATFNLFGFTGNPIASNQWYKISGGTTNLLGSQTGQSLVLPNVQLSDTASYFAIITNSSGSSTSAVVTLTVTASPTISGIAPSVIATNVGSTAVFTVTASLGVPTADIRWYKISNSVPTSVTNLIAGATTTNLTLTSITAADTANYFVILSNSTGSATSAIVTLLITNFPPVITSITPAAITNGAGATASFTVANSGTPPFGYYWIKNDTTLVPGATNSTLTLTNITASDTAGYQVVITNASPYAVTSSVVTLTVTNDPRIVSQPVNTYGLLGGTIYFHVGVAGTLPTYQWYYSDGAGNLGAALTDGALSGSSVVSGSTSATLTVANLQTADLTALTNLVVVVTGIGGSMTSAPASLLSIDTTGVALAFWDFNGQEFTNTVANPTSLRFPVPYIGYGTAKAVGQCDLPGTSPFSGAVDPNNAFGFDGSPFFVYPPSVPAGFPGHAASSWFSWGTSAYPLVPTNTPFATNKANGVQFSVSTAGARHIRLSYQSRVSATASEFYRVQFTTNGTDWIDYPTSSRFNGLAGGNNWFIFTNDFTGFAAVDNNPNFAVRVVSEWQSTATYGVGTTNNWVGAANLYTSGGNTTLNTGAGTVTYDVVTLYGDAITDANAAPVVVGLMDTNTLDYIKVTNNFTVSDDITAPDSLSYEAEAMDPSIVNPTFTFTGSGPNRSLIITPNPIVTSVGATPIKVTITDGNGESAISWFVLTLVSSNLPPTNSLVKLAAAGGTNTIANTALTVPFFVNDDHTTNTSLTDYTVASGNNTLVPAANIVVGNTGTTNPTVTITPAYNQLGLGLVSVTLNDDDVLEPKFTTANIPFMVRPNTNVVLIDYFNYDNPGALDQQAAGFWAQLSGNFGQLKVGLDGGIGAPNTARIDASGAATENIEAPLLGAPYRTNSGSVLYASYTLNMPDSNKMPLNNGTYITAFNDGRGNQFTSDVECLLVVATNNATPGYYRLGIGNRNGATFLTSVQYPVDLQPGSNYVVVTALVVSNGYSTLWVNPQSETSPSVTDTTPPATPTNLYNIAKFELRESGQPNGGQVNIGSLKIGTTFDSVLPAPHVQIAGTNAVVTWSDPTIGLKATTDLTMPFLPISGATTPYTNALSPFNTLFFQLGQ